MRHDPLNNVGSARRLPSIGAERRGEPRHLAVRWVGRLCSGGLREMCEVRNLSSAGLVAQVITPRRVGDLVHIDLPGGQQLAGEVSWAGEASIELHFLAPIDLAELVAAEGVGGGEMVGPPQEMSCQGQLRMGSEAFPVEIRDLSQSGARILTTVDFVPDQPVILAIDGLPPVGGQVRWSEGGCAGVSFLTAIPFDELTHWVVQRETQVEQGALSRRWPRHSIFFRTWLMLPDMHGPTEAYVHNISRGGLLASCRRGLHRGEPVVIDLGRIGEVPGHVAWIDNDRAGFSFSRTIDTHEVLRPFASDSVPPILHHHVEGRRPGLKVH